MSDCNNINKLLLLGCVGGITHFFFCFHVTRRKRVSSLPVIFFVYHRDLGLGLVSSTQVGFTYVCVWERLGTTQLLPDCDPHACGIIVRHCCCCCCNYGLQGWLGNNTRRRPTEEKPRKHMYYLQGLDSSSCTAKKKKCNFWSFVRDGWATSP